MLVTCETSAWQELAPLEKDTAQEDILQKEETGNGKQPVFSEAVIVRLLPLSFEVVAGFLTGQDDLAGLAEALDEEDMATFASALSSPLVLEAAANVFRDTPAETIRQCVPEGNTEACREWLLDTSLARALEQFPEEANTTGSWERERVLGWLGWLAATTRERNERVFRPSHPPLGWLPRKTRVRLLGTHFATAIVLCGLPVMLGVRAVRDTLDQLLISLASGEVSLIFSEDITLFMHETGRWLSFVAWTGGDWSSALFLALFTAISAAAVFGSHKQVPQTGFRWQWKTLFSPRALLERLLHGIALGEGAGIVFAAVLALFIGQRIGFTTGVYDALKETAPPWIVLGIASGFLASITNTAIHDLKETDIPPRTDSAARTSLQNGLGVLTAVLFVSGLAGLITAILLDQIEQPLDGLRVGLVAGLPLALVLAWRHGLGPFTWNRILQRTLTRTGLLPPAHQIPALLNTALDNHLLYPYGNSYCFSHPHIQTLLTQHTSPEHQPTTTQPDPGGSSLRNLALLASVTVFFLLTSPYDDHLATALLNQQTETHLDKGNYRQAHKTATHAHKINNTLHPPNHPNIALTLGNLGNVEHGLGNYAEAKRFYERALKIDEAHYGPDHPQVAGTLNNLGNAESDTGNYAEGKRLLERALKIDEAYYGPNHHQVALDLNNLGAAEEELGNYVEAKRLLKRALKIWEAHYGPDHSQVALTLNNLGIAEKRLGNYVEAKRFYERALKIWEAHYGSDHSQVAFALNNLGILEQDLGNYTEAKHFLERALKIKEAYYGPDHSQVALTLNNFGILEQDLGNYAEAKRLLERALKIWEAHYGPDHSRVAIALNNLGAAESELGNYVEAKRLLERTLKIWEAYYGPDHPEVARTLGNLGLLERELGNSAVARVLWERALTIYEEAGHPDADWIRGLLAEL